jgi:hypothetical protein
MADNEFNAKYEMAFYKDGLHQFILLENDKEVGKEMYAYQQDIQPGMLFFEEHDKTNLLVTKITKEEGELGVFRMIHMLDQTYMQEFCFQGAGIIAFVGAQRYTFLNPEAFGGHFLKYEDDPEIEAFLSRKMEPDVMGPEDLEPIEDETED